MNRAQFKQLEIDSLYYMGHPRYEALVTLVHEAFDEEEAALAKEQAKEET